MAAPSFAPSMDELSAAIERRARDWLAERRRAVPESAPLIDAIERLFEAGGKRLRPAFCYWGYRAADAPGDERIVGVAASLELLHTFAIVHDDIMDGSEERRGMQSLHSEHGLGFGVLAGDLALVLADSLFLLSAGSVPANDPAIGAYGRMRQEVIAGQLQDLLFATREDISENEARRIAVLKSGRYSVVEPLLIGALLGGASDELLAGLERFAMPLGEAFQIRDDLLGTFGERSTTGKPTDSDIREGKRHVLYAKTVAALDGSERAYFVDTWGRGEGLTHDQVERLRSLIEQSGARAATEGLLAELGDEAGKSLDRLPVSPEVAAALTALARGALDRQL